MSKIVILSLRLEAINIYNKDVIKAFTAYVNSVKIYSLSEFI